MEEDTTQNDDLMSRRMKAGTSADSAKAAEHAADSELDDTATFEAFPAVKPAESASRSKPANFSEEEWDMLSSGSSGSGSVSARSVTAGSAAATSAASTSADTASHTDPRFYRRFGFGDFIASGWMIIAMPIMIFALAIRILASGAFLKFEYFINPWFPEDSYGFTADDRMHYASYVVDYLSNLDESRYLADIVLPTGTTVFTAGEVSHMADVKNLISLLFFLGVVGLIGSVLGAVHLSRRYGPGMRVPLKWGGLLTLILTAGLTVLALLGWESFFANFHHLFFTDGTWQFYLDDSLIRLFPPQFWLDSGIAAGVIVLICSLALLLFARIGHRQRKAAKAQLAQYTTTGGRKSAGKAGKPEASAGSAPDHAKKPKGTAAKGTKKA